MAPRSSRALPDIVTHPAPAPGMINQLSEDRSALLPVCLWKKPVTTNLAVERPGPTPAPQPKAAISAVWANLERHPRPADGFTLETVDGDDVRRCVINLNDVQRPFRSVLPCQPMVCRGHLAQMGVVDAGRDGCHWCAPRQIDLRLQACLRRRMVPVSYPAVATQRFGQPCLAIEEHPKRRRS